CQLWTPGMVMPNIKTCAQCDVALSSQNKSGYCRAHFAKHGLPADHGQRVSKALKWKYAADPEAKERVRECARRNLFTPKAKAGRQKAAREIRLWEKG